MHSLLAPKVGRKSIPYFGPHFLKTHGSEVSDLKVQCVTALVGKGTIITINNQSTTIQPMS